MTQPDLPPIDDFMPYLSKIWENKILTNGGPFHQQLEQELQVYLQADQVSLFSNGTIALIVALQALEITGEVITTPFSFVATCHSLIWRNLTPVFVDIDPKTFNIDPKKIEEKITSKTSCILPVHCYGNPCELEAIEKIAQQHHLKVIYDAAHAFGVKSPSQNLFRFGDLSVLSFHATKVFNTFEGGAIISHSPEMKKRIDLLKNFGISNETTIDEVGINGKMNEVQAAFGVLQLKRIEESILKRKQVHDLYMTYLADIQGVNCFQYQSKWTQNYSYFPILITKEYPISRDDLYEKLKEHDIFSRRYFYPLISNLSTYSHIKSASLENLPNANLISNQVICLPLYAELKKEEITKIAEIIRQK